MFGRVWLGVLVAPLAVSAALVTAPIAGATAALTSSYCMDLHLPGGGGYTFTLTGTGFDPVTPYTVQWSDNVKSYDQQFQPVLTDATGMFTTDLFGGVGQTYPVDVEVLDSAGATVARTRVTCTSSSPTPGCVAVGHAHAAGNFKLGPGNTDDVHVEADGDCDYDKKTGLIVLHHAKVLVHNGPGPAVIDAKSDDVIGVAIVDASDAVLTGTYKGHRFTVTLHDGGKSHSNDSVDVVYDTTVVISSASAPHGNVHIDDH
jgi:hypothetical protein